MKKTILFYTLPLLFATQCDKIKAPDAPPAGAPKANYAVNAVSGYIVSPSRLTEGITASGSLLPVEETELHPEASGRIISLNLPEGRAVKQGDLLAKINDEDLQSQLRKYEVQLKQAEITEQRLGELLKVKGVSQQEYDLASLAVQNLKNEMEIIRVNIRKTELRAPYSGVLGLRRISPGAYVTPATAITSIRSNGALKLDFAVPEKYSPSIRTGMPITFKVQGDAQEHAAVIEATEQSISEDTRNLTVRARVKSTGKNLLPGAFAEVQLMLGGNSEALMVPTEALIPQARDKKVIVAKNGKAVFVTVKTGVRQADKVEITEGLQSGDTIATSGILFLRPDGPIKFNKVDK